MIDTLASLGFLTTAVTDDLFFKKFHNKLFMVLTGLGLLYVFFFSPLSHTQALSGFLVGGALMLPLVLVGALGAGDMKFMMCFGLIMGARGISEVFIYAIFWGAFIGILQALLAGQILKVYSNLKGLAYKLKPEEVQKIPYTVAIFLGWASHSQWGGFL